MNPVSILLCGADSAANLEVANLVKNEIEGLQTTGFYEIEHPVLREGLDAPEMETLILASELFDTESTYRDNATSFILPWSVVDVLARWGLVHEKLFAGKQLNFQQAQQQVRSVHAINTMTLFATFYQYSAIYNYALTDPEGDAKDLDSAVRLLLSGFGMDYDVVMGTVEDVAARIVADINKAREEVASSDNALSR